MLLRSVSERLARQTTRRGFLGRGAEVAFGALIGVAAGSAVDARGASAGTLTVCDFPGLACPCDGCQSNGVCAKPCIIMTEFYASGCWVTLGGVVTCCDCDCNGRVPGFPTFNICGCGTDYHNNTNNCP